MEKAIEQEKKVAKEPIKKTVLRIVVYLAFAVVLVLNAYDLKMNQSAIIACWVISGFIVVLVLKMVIELFTRKEN